jgi:hypothetical protein
MKGNDNSTAGTGAFGGIDRLAFLPALDPFAVIAGLGSAFDVLPEISTSLCGRTENASLSYIKGAGDAYE